MDDETREYHLPHPTMRDGDGYNLAICGKSKQWLTVESKNVHCQNCLRARRDDLLYEAAAISRRIDFHAYNPRIQAPRHPCGCRSVGECTHSNGPTSREDKLALNRLVAELGDALRVKLHRQVDQGNGGWDNEDWHPGEIQAALIEHIAKGDPLDVAAFAAFWWNRNEPANAYWRDKENPRAKLPRGQRRTQVARRKSATRRR